METLGITFGDLVVLGILVIGGFMGMALGLVKAILFVSSWVGAALIAFYSYGHVQPYFQELLQDQLYANISAGASVFIVSLIVLFWFFSRIWIAVRNSEFSGLDRSLGLLGGLFVGIILVCIAYLGATWIWEEEKLPRVIVEARARPYVEIGAGVIRSFLPENAQKSSKAAVDKAQGQIGKGIQDRILDAQKSGRVLEELLKRSGDSGQSSDDTQKGYATPSRRDMDRLIESKQ